MAEVAPNAETRRQGHEERDVQLRPLIISGIILATLVGLTLLGIWLLFDYFAARQTRLAGTPFPEFEARQLPPEPRLQVSPRQDLQEMLRAEMAMLHSYGWVDRQAGIVRIPIERAIDLLVERGLPSTPERQGAAAQDKGTQP